MQNAPEYAGRKFIGDIGKGHDETITIVDVTLDGGGEPPIHITFNDDDRRYGYSLKRFDERFSHHPLRETIILQAAANEDR